MLGCAMARAMSYGGWKVRVGFLGATTDAIAGLVIRFGDVTFRADSGRAL